MSSIRAPGQFTPLPNPVPHIQTEVCFGRGKDIMVHGAMLPDADGYYCCRSMGEGLNRPCFKALKDIDLAQHVSCSNILCKFALPSSSSCSSLSPPLLLPSLLSSGPSSARPIPCVSITCKHRRLSTTSPPSRWLTVSYRCGDDTVSREIYTRTSTNPQNQKAVLQTQDGTILSSSTEYVFDGPIFGAIAYVPSLNPSRHPIAQPSVTWDLYRYLRDGTFTGTPVAK